jgi:Rrf2 family transcriptional regulator, iron-sulfur cluster assembly transcription factor
MKISTQSRYGLRALFDIAYYSAGSSTQVKEISARQSISPRYIEQIFQKLKRAGIIKSVRGPSGGYYLARKADEIRVGDIVRATEGTIELVKCYGTKISSKKKCERIEGCAVRNLWTEASSTLMTYLDSVTLQDLCDEAQKNNSSQCAGLTLDDIALS